MKRTTASFADEQQARLNAIGLSDETSIAANENAPTRSELYGETNVMRPLDIETPVNQSLAAMIDHGSAAGFVDVRLGRPPSAAIRFIEGRWHYESMDLFPAFVDAYERAWKAGAK